MHFLPGILSVVSFSPYPFFYVIFPSKANPVPTKGKESMRIFIDGL